jgi:hypothetical protein
MSNEIRPLDITEYKTARGKSVWARDVPMSAFSSVSVLPPSGPREEHLYVLNLADFSEIFISDAQAKAIAYAVAKTAMEEA